LLRVKVPSYDTQTYYNSAFCKKKNLQRGWQLKAKSKAVPLHREGVWGERKYSSCSFSTSALDGGEWSASRPGARTPRYSLYRRLGGPQSRSEPRGERKNPFVSAGERNSIARSSSP
jgi:hypothetical protein